MVAKKTAPAKKAAPAKAAEAAPAEKTAPARKTAPAKKTAPARKTTAAAKPEKPEKTEKPDKAEKAAAPARTASKKKAPAKAPAKTAAKTPAKNATKVPAKAGSEAKAAKAASARKPEAPAAVPGELAVRPGEEPWSPTEVNEARSELQSEVLRLRAEIAASEEAISGLMRDSGDGAGDDQADTGTKNITREHELALAANAQEMLLQTERALERLDAGTYGLCENCGKPIGKARMQAFPRATLCVECKQRQERR
ncbi:TraR/DksA family transcriptional regulator [Streptomyces sp. NPDC001719]